MSTKRRSVSKATAENVDTFDDQKRNALEWAEKQGIFKGKKGKVIRESKADELSKEPYTTRSRKSTPKRREYISPPGKATPTPPRTRTRSTSRKPRIKVEDTTTDERLVSTNPISPVKTNTVSSSTDNVTTTPSINISQNVIETNVSTSGSSKSQQQQRSPKVSKLDMERLSQKQEESNNYQAEVNAVYADFFLAFKIFALIASITYIIYQSLSRLKN